MLTETVAEALNRLLGAGYLVIAFGLMGAAPLGLLFLFLFGLRAGRGSSFGLLAGITVAVWASLCWIVVPYCGCYPNIPGAAIGGVAFGVGTWGQEICIHLTNLTLWPLLGWLPFWLAGQAGGASTMSLTERRRRIVEAVPITKLVGHYQPLRRSGATLEGHCPFHDDSFSSLSVDPSSHRFVCRVCGVSGDVVDYVCMYEHLEIDQALEMLETRTNS